MNVLWVTHQILPYVAKELGVNNSGFGGWVTNMIEQLRQVPDLNIGIAMVSDAIIDGIEEYKIDDRLVCYVAPILPNKSINDSDRDKIIARFVPDIIHIEGNECGIQNRFSSVKDIPVLVSLQGILSGIAPYHYGCLPIADNLFSNRNRMMFSSWILYFRKHLRFDYRIAIETQTIQNATNIMGRTYWDRAHSYWINPAAKYYSCNRILRSLFYENRWYLDNAEKYSIFVGNGYSPLKGIHFVIKAMTLLKKEYPNVRLYCAGTSPIEPNKKSIKHYGYSSVISNLIRDNHLEDNVIFMGSQLADKMVEKMLGSHIYVLPSLIENSPNTLGEAMILGMPCISAYTGGASEMAVDEVEALFYRANDYNLLAWQIKRIFDNDDLAQRLGRNARKHAMKTHNPIANREALLSAYKDIFLRNSKKLAAI